MPRSSRAASAAGSPETARKRRSSRASSTAAKRQKYNSSVPTTPKATPKSVKSTTKKSRYFQGEDSKDKANSEDLSQSNAEDVDTIAPSAKATKSPAARHATPKNAAKILASEEKQEVSQSRRSSTAKGKADKAKELWREGVKTGLGPGKAVFISKPKARDPGETPYKDEALHPNTMLFLQDLAENNEREWLKAHDADYRASKKDWETFVETLTEKITEKDGTIPELPAKDLVFRIHRDIRFSKDPTPYKTHFSAAWSRTGKKGPYAAYYVHCQPGSCFVGSGLWHPEADKLALLREEIDRDSIHLKTILREEGVRREFFDGIPDDEENAVKAFVNQNKETALKTKPKGYGYDNENIELLRLRSFTIGKPLTDEELLSSNVQETIANIIGIMEPFVTYLNSLVMPDAAGQDHSIASDTSDD